MGKRDGACTSKTQISAWKWAWRWFKVLISFLTRDLIIFFKVKARKVHLLYSILAVPITLRAWRKGNRKNYNLNLGEETRVLCFFCVLFLWGNTLQRKIVNRVTQKRYEIRNALYLFFTIQNPHFSQKKKRGNARNCTRTRSVAKAGKRQQPTRPTTHPILNSKPSNSFPPATKNKRSLTARLVPSSPLPPPSSKKENKRKPVGVRGEWTIGKLP